MPSLFSMPHAEFASLAVQLIFVPRVSCPQARHDGSDVWICIPHPHEVFGRNKPKCLASQTRGFVKSDPLVHVMRQIEQFLMLPVGTQRTRVSHRKAFRACNTGTDKGMTYSGSESGNPASAPFLARAAVVCDGRRSTTKGTRSAGARS